MDVETWTGWATLAGAVIAAISGVWSLLIQLRGKRDGFIVRLGSSRPEMLQETMLHVVSLSDHPVQIADYGFIDANHRLSSFSLELEEFCEETQVVGRGELLLEGYSSIFERGYLRRTPSIGAFARSATQSRPRLSFRHDVSMWKRLVVRVKVLLKGRRYLL